MGKEVFDATAFDLAAKIRSDASSAYLPVMREKTCDLLFGVAEKLRPSEILEIGTCVGVSGLTVLSACRGRLTTVEIDAERAEIAGENFAKAGFSDRVTIVNDDCFVALDYLQDNRYDLVVLDGPKGHCDELFSRLKPMLNPGGVLFVDDVDFHGLTEGKAYPDHKHRTIVNATRRFLQRISTDPDFIVERYEIEDGVIVATKK